MGIIQIPTALPSQTGLLPATKKMVTTDNLSTITTAGYLNSVNLEGNPIGNNDILEVIYSYNTSTNSGTYGEFTVSISNNVITLVNWVSSGNVLLPVVSGDFAVFNGTTGQIKDAGYAPSDNTKSIVAMVTGSITANHVAVFSGTSGTITDDVSTAVNNGNFQAGTVGTSGAYISFPPTASNGRFIFQAVNAGANFDSTIRNSGSIGQATNYNLPDPANANAQFLVGATGSPFVSGEFPVASGTSGLMVSSGLAATNIQNKTNIKAVTSGNIGGGGAGPLTVTQAGVTTSSVIVASIVSSSNTVSISKVTPGTGNFTVLFSADPGASCVINYVVFIAAQ